ncbi:MAG: CUAEP/CCAEP-tail radical SAM (seleno)protein [Acidimicrobiia bacterium]
MRVLLVSTYELGHQPLHVASPAASLAAAGHDVRTLDLAVETWDLDAVAWAEAVAVSVPMHTALRLAQRWVEVVRALHPDLPVCLYGLYANLASEDLADRRIAGEYEPALLEWVAGLGPEPTAPPASVELGRSSFLTPKRDTLPPLDRYAHLALGEERRLAGYVEASHGCLHRCRHCPVPVVYDGRLRIVPEDVVLADAAAQVEAGARHITFGDPDFLNGPMHSLRIVRRLHERFPHVTFDCTAKVDHILRHADLWPEMAGAGCLFVISAFESVNDNILDRLDKGHTAAQAAEVVTLLRGHGIEVRPSFLPFTPWTTADDIVDLVDFVAEHDLVGNVEPVQYTIRLLIPAGSLLADDASLAGQLGPYDPERLTWTWSSVEPAVDELQRQLAGLVERDLHAGEPIASIHGRVRAAAYEAAGRAGALIPELIPLGAGDARPRLTEPWFC